MKKRKRQRAITQQKQLFSWQTPVLATAPAPQNSATTRDAVQGILRREVAAAVETETTMAACAKKPSEQGSEWKTSTVSPSSAKVTWDKEESSEEPDPWGRRPDHAPVHLGLLTTALQQQLAQGYNAAALGKSLLSEPMPLKSVFHLFKHSFVQDKAYLPLVWVSISCSVFLIKCCC